LISKKRAGKITHPALIGLFSIVVGHPARIPPQVRKRSGGMNSLLAEVAYGAVTGIAIKASLSRRDVRDVQEIRQGGNIARRSHRLYPPEAYITG
jgi:hypothetical protein